MTRTFDELSKLYTHISDIDEEFGTELGMDGEPVQFEYDAGCITPEIAKADKERRLLTMIDGDDDKTLFRIGLGFVNRITYYATERPMPGDLYTSQICVEA